MTDHVLFFACNGSETSIVYKYSKEKKAKESMKTGCDLILKIKGTVNKALRNHAVSSKNTTESRKLKCIFLNICSTLCKVKLLKNRSKPLFHTKQRPKHALQLCSLPLLQTQSARVHHRHGNPQMQSNRSY